MATRLDCDTLDAQVLRMAIIALQYHKRNLPDAWKARARLLQTRLTDVCVSEGVRESEGYTL